MTRTVPSIEHFAKLPIFGGRPKAVSPATIARVLALFRGFAPKAFIDVLSLAGSPCMSGSSCEYMLNANGVEEVLGLHKEWLAVGFVPIAGDGCGNYFVAHPGFAGGCPVLFVDTIASLLEPAYIVASDIEHFMAAVLNREDWFDSESITRNDPQVFAATTYCLPWAK